MTANTPITKLAIDKAAHEYMEAKAAEDLAAERTAKARETLTAMVQAHGTTPPRSDKSLRLEGEQYQATVTQGQSTSINQTAVLAFFKYMEDQNISSRFKKIFRREVRFSLAAGCDDLIAQMSGRSKQLVQACIAVTTNNPKLKVERREKGAAA